MSLATSPHLRSPDSPPSPDVVAGPRRPRTAAPARRVRSLTLAALLVVSATVGALVVPTAGTAEASTRTPVMQPNQVSAEGIAAWYRTAAPSGYRATVSPATLARYFIEEGRAEGVAGDIAFAQAILETGWFRWPSHGQVHATYNNFSGIGACDGGTCTVARFRSARIGARAQMQHLRAYADPNVTVARLANPLESPRFHLVTPKGKAPTWEQMGAGNWATDPQYASKILSIYRSMLTHAERNGGLAGPITLAGNQRFADVPLAHAHRPAIEALADRAVVNGCSGTHFCPGRSVTRGQLATMLAKALDLPPAPSQPFRDVSAPHADSIARLQHAGITQGCSRRDFCPDRPVTRGQLAAMLQRALELPGTSPSFSDTRQHEHRLAIGAVAREGIATGFRDGTFRPNQAVDRGQAATFVDRATR